LCLIASQNDGVLTRPHGVLAAPQPASAAAPHPHSGPRPAGGHCGHGTTPGSVMSRPSKKLVSSAVRRSTYDAGALAPYRGLALSSYRRCALTMPWFAATPSAATR